MNFRPWMLAAVALTGCGGGPSFRAVDVRRSVTVSEEQRALVLVEMNAMLRSLNGALAAAARADTAALAVAVKPSGMAAAADPALEAVLPAEWTRYAEAVHGGFDTLAARSRVPMPAPALRDTTLAVLARVTTGCTACHATFRLATK